MLNQSSMFFSLALGATHGKISEEGFMKKSLMDTLKKKNDLNVGESFEVPCRFSGENLGGLPGLVLKGLFQEMKYKIFEDYLDGSLEETLK